MREKLFFFVLFTVFTGSVFAQLEHGRITYAVRLEDSGFSEEELAMLPAETSVLFSPDRMRMNMSMGAGIESAVIVQEDNVHLLMDVLGEKFAIRTSKEEIRKDSKGRESYRLKELLDEYKEIAGYRCRKALLAAKNQDDMTVWYTDRLKTSATWYYRMDGLDGFPMEFDLNITGMDLRMSARSVSDEMPPEEVFAVGGDYKLLTQDEVNKMMGSGR